MCASGSRGAAYGAHPILPPSVNSVGAVGASRVSERASAYKASRGLVAFWPRARSAAAGSRRRTAGPGLLPPDLRPCSLHAVSKSAIRGTTQTSYQFLPQNPLDHPLPQRLFPTGPYRNPSRNPVVYWFFSFFSVFLSSILRLLVCQFNVQTGRKLSLQRPITHIRLGSVGRAAAAGNANIILEVLGSN